nr:hypothetical protein OG690_33115 [Streptomyces tubercidicus]
MAHGRMGFWAAVLLLVAGAAVLLVALEYWFVALTLVAAPYLLAAVTRRAELRADHHAAAAGFGPMLAEVLHMMQAADRESGSVTASALSGCGPGPPSLNPASAVPRAGHRTWVPEWAWRAPSRHSGIDGGDRAVAEKQLTLGEADLMGDQFGFPALP